MLFQTHSFIKSQYERIEIEKKEESILNVVRKINCVVCPSIYGF
jgi:hypothetical protein